jgi:hypothetical protein
MDEMRTTIYPRFSDWRRNPGSNLDKVPKRGWTKSTQTDIDPAVSPWRRS